MPDALNCLINRFADGTKMYASVDSTQEKKKIQESIDKLVQCPDKCQIGK